ncbi:hypothetical protein [Maribellus sediminis]|uniref:hypothetical protein n=1 Tax=Maribellus sediminis TaxID=2696285 RepID=UPI00143055A6|nr:hypothetical protein [Maribellus sediminis]
MKLSTLLLMITILFAGCGLQTKKQEQLRQQQFQDSIQLATKQAEESRLIAEQAKRDSINRVEEKIAIANINFEISKKEFNTQKSQYLKRLDSSPYPSYHIGQYGFSDIYGSFYDNKLYYVSLWGNDIKYDDYDSRMQQQYNSLMSVLKEKYGEPKSEKGLPKWNELNKGDIASCSSWELGNKDIDVIVRCNGVEYNLLLNINRTDIAEQEYQARKKQEAESSKTGADLL